MGNRLPSLNFAGLELAAQGYARSGEAARLKGERQVAALNRIGSSIAGGISHKKETDRADRIRAEDNVRSDRRWEESKALERARDDMHRAEFGIRYKQGQAQQIKDEIDSLASMPDDTGANAAKIQELTAAWKAAQDDTSALVDQYARNPARKGQASTSFPDFDSWVAQKKASGECVDCMVSARGTYESERAAWRPPVAAPSAPKATAPVSSAPMFTPPPTAAQTIAKTKDTFIEATANLERAKMAKAAADGEVEKASRGMSGAKGAARNAWMVRLNAATDRQTLAEQDIVRATAAAEARKEKHAQEMRLGLEAERKKMAAIELSTNQANDLMAWGGPEERQRYMGADLTNETTRRMIDILYRRKKEERAAAKAAEKSKAFTPEYRMELEAFVEADPESVVTDARGLSDDELRREYVLSTKRSEGAKRQANTDRAFNASQEERKRADEKRLDDLEKMASDLRASLGASDRKGYKGDPDADWDLLARTMDRIKEVKARLAGGNPAEATIDRSNARAIFDREVKARGIDPSGPEARALAEAIKAGTVR